MIRIGICDDLVEQLQIQEEMVRNIVCRLGLNTEIKCFQSGEDLLWEMEQKGKSVKPLFEQFNDIWAGESSNRRCNKMLLFYSASAQGAGKSQKVF